MSTRLMEFASILLRVPPILIVDEILKIRMDLNGAITEGKDSNFAMNGLGGHMAQGDTISVAQGIANSSSADALGSGFNCSLTCNPNFSSILSLIIVKFILCLLVFLCTSWIFMLRTKQLFAFYMFIVSKGLILLSYSTNMMALELIERNPEVVADILSFNTARLFDFGGTIKGLTMYILAQCSMGLIFSYLHSDNACAIILKWMPLIFTSPILIGMLPIQPIIIHTVILFVEGIQIYYSKIDVVKVARDFYNAPQYIVNFVSSFALPALIENEWQRLKIPRVLRLFWILRVARTFLSIANFEGIPIESFLPTIFGLLIDGCGTLIAVLGMTSMISVICHYIGRAFERILLTINDIDDKSLGTISAVLFYTLALITDLPSLPPDEQMKKLYCNSCLSFTILLHFLHNMLTPVLMSLSAGRNSTLHHHVRALIACVLLILTSIGVIIALWANHSASTWLLAVTAFALEVIVKVIVSIATYTLFVLNARRQTFWENLDDYLFYVNGLGNTLQFSCGAFLLCNSSWVFMYETTPKAAGGFLRVILMFIHGYYNIWSQGQVGWTIFSKRRTAMNKLSALREATPKQLQDIDDICAICYEEMNSATITRCGHFFHAMCLKKWLYVKDCCPLCHQIMINTKKSADKEEHQDANVRILPNNERNPDEGFLLQYYVL